MATASAVTRNRNTVHMNRIPAASEKKESGDKPSQAGKTTKSALMAPTTSYLNSTLATLGRWAGVVSRVNWTSAKLALTTTMSGDILRTSSLMTWLASWLHISCAIANFSMRPRVVDVLNSTAFEIGHWAGILESLIPLVNTFQLATIPLNRQRRDIQLNRVGFVNKTLLVDSLQQYSRGVCASGQSMYNVTLATTRLVKAMLYNFGEIEESLRTALETDFEWWRSSRKEADLVNTVVSGFLRQSMSRFSI
ncbi:hypothetical protein H2202_007733 [Exophiala xenobiotica]|nr:hypothetical protein H2202_007733 [Exophiala xenobiotica]